MLFCRQKTLGLEQGLETVRRRHRLQDQIILIRRQLLQFPPPCHNCPLHRLLTAIRDTPCSLRYEKSGLAISIPCPSAANRYVCTCIGNPAYPFWATLLVRRYQRQPMTHASDRPHTHRPHTLSQPLLPRPSCLGCRCRLSAILRISFALRGTACNGDRVMAAVPAQFAMTKQTKVFIGAQDVALPCTAAVPKSCSLSVPLLSILSKCVQHLHDVSLACSTPIGSTCRLRQRNSEKLG